jgi:hypothetical protein
MIISHKYRFIFIKNSKTAGTSIELFLDSVCGVDDVLTPFWHSEEGHHPRNYRGTFNPVRELWHGHKYRSPWGCRGVRASLSDLWLHRKFYEAMPAWLVRCRIPRGIWESYYKFAVERNPWDKVLSRRDHWNRVNKIGKTVTIDEFLDWLEGELANPWISVAPYNLPRYVDPRTGDVLVDRMCRYENLNAELTDVFGQLGISFDGELGPRAKAQYRQDRRHFSEILSDNQQERIGRIFAKEIRLWGYSRESLAIDVRGCSGRGAIERQRETG